jgi:Zn-dependent peptidase ImmA (M78 family)
MNRNDIELSVRKIQREMWLRKDALLKGTPLTIRDIVEPRIVAIYLGIDYQEYPDLGNFGQGRDRFAVAGLLNRQEKKIAVSRKFPLATSRFTAGHEIGHWVLHDDQMVMHRDRPISGMNSSVRSEAERDADYFSACLLVPRKQLRLAIAQFFDAADTVRIDERVAYILAPDDPEALLRGEDGLNDAASALATARHFEGRRFDSLSCQFGVSVSTMAIRLRELGMVQH